MYHYKILEIKKSKISIFEHGRVDTMGDAFFENLKRLLPFNLKTINYECNVLRKY